MTSSRIRQTLKLYKMFIVYAYGKFYKFTLWGVLCILTIKCKLREKSQGCRLRTQNIESANIQTV